MVTIFLSAIAVWALSGVIIALILARHGHNFWLFALIGLVYGPFVLVVWFKGARGQQSRSLVLQTGDRVRGDGWIDVLVGLDGSEGSLRSAQQVLWTLEGAVRRVRVASVLDHEISNQPDAFTHDEDRVAYLGQAVHSLGLPGADVVLLSGQPDKALLEHAEQNNFDLLVIAHRTNDVLTVLHGSVASRLVRTADMPVLIGPPA